jgi:hypothetical protein
VLNKPEKKILWTVFFTVVLMVIMVVAAWIMTHGKI